MNYAHRLMFRVHHHAHHGGHEPVATI